MDRLTDAAQLDGWIPVRLNWTNGQPTIDWCYLGKRGFTEPFFEHTVEVCLRYPANLLFRHQTPIEVLHQLSESRPGLKPTGLVFHMSRCGSTLTSRMLGALPESLVISEARPIDATLRAHLRDERLTDVERINWLHWLVSALGQQRLGTERLMFIIFHSWNAVELPLVRRAFPDVPWVFLYRDPLEVLASQLRQRGAETIPSVFPSEYFGLRRDSAVLMEPEEYCARVLAANCQAALRQHADSGMLVNYTQLAGNGGSLIMEFFGVSYSGAEETAANPTHSLPRGGTDVSGNVNVTEAAKNASERARQVADRLLYPIYEELETARLAQPQTHCDCPL